MKQQSLLDVLNKNKYKAIPNELLVDIFKSINTTPCEVLQWKIKNNTNVIIGISRNRYRDSKISGYWWNRYVGNLLISSSILYMCIGKAFHKKKVGLR